MSKVEVTAGAATAAREEDGAGEFIQVKKKGERQEGRAVEKQQHEKKKSKSRSRNNSIGEGKSNKAR